MMRGIFLIISTCFAQNFVDICNDSSGNECCASEGMEDHTYWVMQSTGTWNSLDIECRIQKQGAKLAVFETKRENDCMVKYLVDEYRGTTAKNYAIGLMTLLLTLQPHSSFLTGPQQHPLGRGVCSSV